MVRSSPVCREGSSPRGQLNAGRRLGFVAVAACIAAAMVFGCRQTQEVAGKDARPEGKLEIHVINVGQGDAILIRCPEGTHEILIDSGELNNRYPESATRFKAYLEAHQEKSNPIELVVATHPHSDHLGSMKWVVENYTIGRYVDCGIPGESALYRNLETALTARGVLRKGAKEVTSEEMDFCPLADVSARVLRPAGLEEVEDPNDWSVVVRVDYKNKSFLFVGDAEAAEEQLLTNDPSTKALLDCDWLKAGHHASETSSKNAFLTAVTPKVTAVSCGERDRGSNKGFKHPRSKTLEHILGEAQAREGPAIEIDSYDSDTLSWKKGNLNSAVYITSAQGDLVFESDGGSIHKR